MSKFLQKSIANVDLGRFKESSDRQLNELKFVAE